MIGLGKALDDLMKVTREYVAPGIEEVDKALENARQALEFRTRLAQALFGTSEYPANEGLNPKGPTWL